MSLTRMRSVWRCVSRISSGPSTTALCSARMFAETTATSPSAGRCLRIRATDSCERSTNRTMSSPSGESVTSTFLSSPVRSGTE